eukprot:6723194-Pyramimonas_sp.AAC.1
MHLCRSTLTTCMGRLHESIEAVAEEQMLTDEILSEYGYKQNLKKQVLAPWLKGYHDNRLFYPSPVGGARVLSHARYLGPLSMPAGALGPQIVIANNAAARGWCAYKDFWGSGAPWK